MRLASPRALDPLPGTAVHQETTPGRVSHETLYLIQHNSTGVLLDWL